MSSVVLDASVLIAAFRNEMPAGILSPLLEGAVISTVTLAEVWTKLYELGLSHAPHVEAALALLGGVAPFTASQAMVAATLRSATRHAGLSLGDRACLALALELGADVYTADTAWTRVNVGCSIHLIR